MKILISLSAVKNFAPGTRVAVEFDKDDWSVGTVVKTTPTGWKIDFDYGEKNRLIKATDGRIQEVAQKRSLKKPLTYAQVKALKPARTAPKPVVKATPAVKTKPTKPARPPVADTEPKETLEEHRLTKEFGRPQLWSKLDHKSGRTEKLGYIHDLWNTANHKLFGGKLPEPAAIKMTRDAGERTQGLGVWYPLKRILGFSPRLFIAPEHRVVETVIHEMCHQAVSEIDRVVDRSRGGHGPAWQAWMRKCGLDPNRYASGQDDFLTQEEKDARQKRLDTLQVAREAAKNSGMVQMTLAHLRTLPRAVMYVNSTTGTTHKGLAVGPHDRAAKRIMVISEPTLRHWVNVPTTWLHLLPEGPDKTRYESPAFKETAVNLLQYVEQRKLLKALRRSSRIG